MTIATIKNKVFSVLNKSTKKQAETDELGKIAIKCNLLPCPCCGGEVKLYRVNAKPIRDSNAKRGIATAPVCFIRCSPCGISTSDIVVEYDLNGTYVTEKGSG